MNLLVISKKFLPVKTAILVAYFITFTKKVPVKKAKRKAYGDIYHNKSNYGRMAIIFELYINI